MTRRVQQRQCEIADAQLLLVHWFFVLECETGARTGDDAGADCGELSRARHEVRVNVRFDRVRDREAVLARGGQVDAGVSSWIDHHGALRAVAPDQKGALREPFLEESLEHGIKSRCLTASAIDDSTRATASEAHRMTLSVVIAVIAAGAVGGCLGSLLGLGGGVFLVPFL